MSLRVLGSMTEGDTSVVCAQIVVEFNGLVATGLTDDVNWTSPLSANIPFPYPNRPAVFPILTRLATNLPPNTINKVG
ncbi:hypothetical protein PPL_01098 [Heterostelium album PN500]|uniref:Uncharacterized protein n=1 Tax=Heterostelium pallidum (strain ATCC 26659 / Pp 5 / PN500) TaxID=670386 RepID=D3AY39_HETP5|nr:hypothetical protein PPL_01098 [Heterostelium album PN500]EFA85866.1 hypothetical protein PPL_01098 [Heterostelium album PN500]|eukprot:XP_020437972.1 hypothetical protein PPL_01098 [Heterostelium album PN500]